MKLHIFRDADHIHFKLHSKRVTADKAMALYLRAYASGSRALAQRVATVYFTE